MGKRAQRRNAALVGTQTAVGARNIQALQQEQQGREQQLASAGRLLGTDEQIAGFNEADVSPYASRYNIDESVFGNYQGSLQNANKGQKQTYNTYFGDRVGSVLERENAEMANNIRVQQAGKARGVDVQDNPLFGKKKYRSNEEITRRALDRGTSQAEWEAALAAVDPAVIQAAIAKREKTSQGSAYGSLIREDVGRANQLMTDAEAAAASGDNERANALKAEADAIVNGLPTVGGITGQDLFRSTSNLDPEKAARAQLSSPLAQTVGTLVKQGKDFMDPESAGSQRFKESLTAGATAQIDRGVERQLGQVRQSQRSAERNLRDTALTRGGGRQLGAEAAIGERIKETAGLAGGSVEATASAQRAEIHGEASKFFETYRTQFSQNIAGFAQAWLANDAGIRDAYQDRLMQTGLAAAQYAQQASQTAMAMYAADASKQTAGQIVGQSVGGLAGNVIGQGLGSLTSAGVSKLVG